MVLIFSCSSRARSEGCGASQRVSPGTAKSFNLPWLGLVFGDAKKWMRLGIAAGRQEEVQAWGRPAALRCLGMGSGCKNRRRKARQRYLCSYKAPILPPW